MMVLMSRLDPDQLELVHRYFDGELSAPEQGRVDALLRDEPEARRVLEYLRSIDRAARNELLSASAEEDFTDWWDHVEQQMTSPSLEPQTDADPVLRAAGTLSVVDGGLGGAPIEQAPRPTRGWLVALAFATVALGTAAGVLYFVLQ